MRSMMIRPRLAFALSLAVAVIAAAAFPWTGGARAAARPTSDECLTCHAQPGFARSDPSRSGSLHVDGATLAQSVHAALACADCHAGATGIPHAQRLPKVRCGACHAAIAKTVAAGIHGTAVGGTPGEESCAHCHGTHAVNRPTRMGPEACAACHAEEGREYRESVHGVALAHGVAEASTCRDCHGSAHSAKSHSDTTSTVSRGHVAETCARCHADQALMTRRKITIPAAYALYKESVHGRSKDPRAATCNDCHESHRIRRANDPTSSIYRANIPATCGRCHTREVADYRVSVHGTALARGVGASPVCTDCHGEHRIQGPRDPGSPVAAAGVTQTCAHCHEATGIRETYGLPAGRLDSYRDSYHGLAARGGSPAVANCASCHGYHRILPSSDPRSAVNAANLPATCGRCHPGAGARFASGSVHVVMANPDRPLLGWVRITYLWLIVLTIGGMTLHQMLHFAGRLRARLREHLGALPHPIAGIERWYLRMTAFERIQHGALALSFSVLVFTGFALKFPETWLFSWLARLEGGYSWRSLIHRGAAVVMVVTAVAHIGYLFTRRGRDVLGALAPHPRDLTEALANGLHLVGLRATAPKFDRFSYIEKAEYWALVWGTVVMTATGVVLWFENQSMQWLNKWLLDLATIVHYYEAWLAFLAILVWHIYQNVLNPDVYPMNWTWISGRISDEQLRHEHGAEWERIQAAEREAAVPEAGEDAEAGVAPPAASARAADAAHGTPPSADPGPPARD
jgi:cytochrome b subunit of formate dehydrogenase